MAKKYNHKKIETKWQEKWEEAEIYRAEFPSKKKKYYLLIEFPYPSGERLHVGHARSYSAIDALARKRRMQGFNVLYPIGWDAFGLPAENYAIKTGIHPSITTKENIANAKKQAKSWGLSFDWSREINTTDPGYYRWTQWIFVQLFKQGLAYRAEIPVNWCGSCKINLANEEVIDGKCERCGVETEKRMQKQWMLKITAYAQRLLDDLQKVNYREDIKQQQVNWIGKSEGCVLTFKVQVPRQARDLDQSIGSSRFKVETFTTRLDTLFGATALVIAPDKMIEIEGKNKHLAEEIAIRKQYQKVKIYIKESQKKSELERTELKEKTGVFTGAYAVNPINGEEIPVWTADYVVGWYGEGAIMLVPGHDERDFEFAKKYGIEIRQVVQPKKETPFEFKRSLLFKNDGILVNSGKYSGLKSEEAREKMLKDGQRAGWVEVKTTYKLRDWVFSRQHYWGEPIPMIFCETCAEKRINWFTISQGGKDYRTTINRKPVDKAQVENSRDENVVPIFPRTAFREKKWDSAGWFPVAEEKLPIELPYVKRYEPTDTGESPLANVSDWIKVPCPHCGGEARRETDTMPNWAGSSWYFIAYPIADKLGNLPSTVGLDVGLVRGQKFNNVFDEGKDSLDYWLPVDWYNGGLEHTTLHLLYSRFWHKFLYDLGVVPTAEPYAKRTSHGVVLGPDGHRMSKSRGNVINPDEIVEKYGADSFRMYEMFMGPFAEQVVWSDAALSGMRRFLQRVHRLYQLQKETPFKFKRSLLERVRRKLHQTIKKVSEDMEELKFNTAIAAMMEFVNEVYKTKVEDRRSKVENLPSTLNPQNLSSTIYPLSSRDAELFLRLLAPFAPHLAEELYQSQKFISLHTQPWPEYDPDLAEEEMIEFVIQVNGKVRDIIKVKSQKSKIKSQMKEMVSSSEKVKKYLAGKKIKKTIFVPGKLINFVAS